MSHVETTRNQNLRTIAIVPASRRVPLTEFTCELYNQLSKHVKTLRLSSSVVENYFESEVITKKADYGLMHWLNVQEIAYSLVLYQCDFHKTNWTRRCLRMADAILMVALGTESKEEQVLVHNHWSIVILKYFVFRLKHYCHAMKRGSVNQKSLYFYGQSIHQHQVVQLLGLKNHIILDIIIYELQIDFSVFLWKLERKRYLDISQFQKLIYNFRSLNTMKQRCMVKSAISPTFQDLLEFWLEMQLALYLVVVELVELLMQVLFVHWLRRKFKLIWLEEHQLEHSLDHSMQLLQIFVQSGEWRTFSPFVLFSIINICFYFWRIDWGIIFLMSFEI